MKSVVGTGFVTEGVGLDAREDSSTGVGGRVVSRSGEAGVEAETELRRDPGGGLSIATNAC